MTILARASAVLLLGLGLSACGSADQPEVLDQPQAGVVPVAMYSNGTSGYQYTVVPSFISAPPADLCSIQTFEPCKVITCPQARSALDQASAGTLHVAAGTNTVDLVPQFKGYMNIQTPSSFFNGGETLSIKADGGNLVPGFNGSVTAPSALLMTAPLDAQLMISQAQDLKLAWTGTSAGVVVLQLTRKDDSAMTDVSVECHLPANTTSGTIPATALAHVAQGQYNADVYTRTRSEVGAGDWSVLLEGQYHAGVAGMGAYKRPAVVTP